MADTTEQQQTKLIDDSSISPVERRNSLEAHLKHRPERAELVETSTAAPGLIAHQKELEKHMLEDKLNDKISHRPDPEALIKEGVLRDDPRSVAQDEAAKKYDEAIEDEYAKREGGA
ncbi:RPEL repeat protein [Fusarium heterosporum]|uniref:RPEL repeat protein n=1 Tax=Fusarium heterosporum TaxID=42747 RepID=A0A8H5WWJ4_FUSHE|nr:RPEL repeat protein [Fusarium heterosporum]